MNTTVQLRLKRLQSLRTDEPGVLNSLRALTDFHSPSLAPHEDRRTLRGAIEQRSVEINEQFLQTFDGLSQLLEGVSEDVTAASKDIGAMTARLQAIKSSSKLLVEHAASASASIRANKERRAAITNFLERFELSEEEKALLTAAPAGAGSKAGEPDIGAVLRVMDRLSELTERASELQQAGQQPTVGAELLAEMGRWQERGHRLLYRWLGANARALDGGAGPPADGVFARALAVLASAPSLLASCVRELGSARAPLLAAAFERALTVGGGPTGKAQPIELAAADPPQYVADMLAWVHAAALAEREKLRSLCDLAAAGAASNSAARAEAAAAAAGGVSTSAHALTAGVPPPANASVASAVEAALPVALTLALERVSRALELRINAALTSGSAAPTEAVGGSAIPRVASVAQFEWLALTLGAHALRFGALLGAGRGEARAAGEEARAGEASPATPGLASPGSELPSAATPSARAETPARATAGEPALASALERCATRARAACDERLRRALGWIERSPPPCPHDLSCPTALTDALSGAVAIVRACETVPDAPAAECAARARSAVELTVRTAREAVEAIALGRARGVAALAPADQLVFRLNCLVAIAAALEVAAHAPPPPLPVASAAPGRTAGAAAAGPAAELAQTECAPRARALREEAAALRDALVEEETSAIFRKCGLAEKLAALQTARAQPSVQLATIPGLEPAAVGALMRTFYALVFSPAAGSLMPHCERVADVDLRQSAVRAVSHNVALAHRSLHEAVSDAANGYAATEPRITLHAPEQVEALLDCAPSSGGA